MFHDKMRDLDNQPMKVSILTQIEPLVVHISVFLLFEEVFNDFSTIHSKLMEYTAYMLLNCLIRVAMPVSMHLRSISSTLN